MVSNADSGAERKITDDEMAKYLGKHVGKLWKRITEYMSKNYDFEPIREKESLDATIRYRKSGKTLLTLYPKEKELTVLIILGKQEVEKFMRTRENFSPEIIDLFINTKQYHDGKWLHIRVPPFDNFDDIRELLRIKRIPSKI
jgi:ribosomal protein L25 (general stress protein Ctc)